ncbi:glycosyltransferase family 2 protein [Synechococcus sp. M16.1]|uniref:glycosyltransferase family 2 protein n=1 Tax=Synechococcus sp. M16.1 TaxID=1442553 RepID=UPI00164598BE|nr:glycosyltransferase [Synechococcus sp. M16.1]
MNIAALCASHNRSHLTLRSVQQVFYQLKSTGFHFTIFVVDSESDDDTVIVLNKHLPLVQIIPAKSDDFWARAMSKGFDFISTHYNFDHLLVFNDDIDLFDNAIPQLFKELEFNTKTTDDQIVICGSFLDKTLSFVSYGGLKRVSRYLFKFSKQTPSFECCIQVDTLNMNLALIPRICLLHDDFLYHAYQHGYADYDFGLQFSKRGGKILLCKGYQGICEHHPPSQIHSKSFLISSFLRLKHICHIKRQPPKYRLLYCWRNSGLLWPFYFLIPYLRAFLSSHE